MVDARARALGERLKDARGHEYEKGERVEDRKYASAECRVDTSIGKQASKQARGGGRKRMRMASAEERFNAFPR